jgi:hypothetical protein
MSIFFNKLIKSTEKFAAGALQEKNCRYNSVFFTAQVAKLVDAGDSKSPAERCVGSSPTLGTKYKKRLKSTISSAFALSGNFD